MLNMSSQPATSFFGLQQTGEFPVVKSHLTPEELLILIKEEENLPQPVSISEYWEYYQNELEFE